MSHPDPGGAPLERVRVLNDAPLRSKARYVLYWMTASRRASWSFPLQRALAWCEALRRPLTVFEPLGCDYPHASHRLHAFVLQGMEDNRAAFAGRDWLRYLAHVVREPGEGRAVFRELVAEACLVVTDDSPAFFLPRVLRAAAKSLPLRLEAVDGLGVLPLRDDERYFARAHDFRRHLHRRLAQGWPPFPLAEPLARHHLPPHPGLPGELTEAPLPALASLPIDASVGPVATRGGSRAARARLAAFCADGLPRYATDGRHPDREATSRLSAHLHFGHLSVHEVLDAVLRRESWTPGQIARSAAGRKQGWWGLSEDSEAFLDQLLTWRELGQRAALTLPDYDRYESLPLWARRTLAEHAGDPRAPCYERAQMEAAHTHDEVWNAAQRELLREGRLHNYLRMLWAKNILAWSRTPQEALETMLYLNDRYALDGRDPNAVSGIFWCLGRHDRPWGPARPVFGSVRYMSSEATRRKLDMKRYLARHAENEEMGRVEVRGP